MISIRSNIMDKLKSKPSYTDPKTGNKFWFKNNKFIEDPNKICWNWGELHRVNGPAIEWANGSKEWWLNGKLHRTDGPAIEWTNGTKYWYLNDKRLSEEQFNAIPMDQRNNYGL